MNLSKIDLSEAVAALLARGEPLTSAQLVEATGKSQASISGAIKALGDRVHRMGAARSTRYALKKDILGLAPEHKLRWLGEGHTGFAAAQLTYLANNWLHCVCQTSDGRSKQWLTQNELPWFLSTLKPQGYLGRKLARAFPALPSDPAHWSLAQLLYSLQYISDPIGAVAVDHMVSRQPYPRISSLAKRDEQFDELASEDAAQRPAGSSAAGEQPKFLASVLWQPCIVKFAPPHGTPFGERWSTLLKLEKLALDCLQSHGVASAQAEIVRTQQHTYLQSTRFDRDAGKDVRHVVAIAAIHDEFVKGSWTNWVVTSEALAKQGLITEQELKQIATVFAFGHYIGNTDMHSGNLSFFVDDVITPKIRLAPVYDMLPMMWRPDPQQGVLSDSPVRKQFMPAGFAAEQAQAREWAIEFWSQAAQLDIGADLQAASVESARRLTTNFADV